MIARFSIFAITLFGLSGCVSPGAGWGAAPQDPAYILVKSNPTGATVTFPDGTNCETPCRLGIVDPVQMTIARIGYAPAVRSVNRNSRSPVVVTLTPVGRSIDIEQVELPDL